MWCYRESGEHFEMVEGELESTCAHVPLQTGSSSCSLMVPSKQIACKEVGFLLLFSSAVGAGDQRAFLQQVILCLSLCSVLPHTRITFK